MKMQKGFTLVELMIVVAIIGLLSAIAYPNYIDYVTRGKITEATSALSENRVLQTQFFLDHKTYDDTKGGTPPCPTATSDFAFDCLSVPPTTTTYNIFANGTGSMAGFQYTIDQANNRTSATPQWGPGGTCWITKKGVVC